MIVQDDGNFAIHKKLLSVIGFWPSANDRSRVFRVMAIYVIYLVHMTLQCVWIFEINCNLNCILYILAILLQYWIGLVKYITYHSNMATVQSLFTQIELDWKLMKTDKSSHGILIKYAQTVRIITMVLVVFAQVYVLGGILLMTFATPARLPTVNCTQFWDRPIGVQEPNLLVCKSPLLILTCTTYLNGFILIVLETTFLLFSEHVCVMMKLAGYHLKHATMQNVYPKTLLAVRAHIKALKFRKRIWKSFGPSYTLLIVFGILSASLSIMSFRQTVIASNDARVIVLLFTFVLIITLYGIMTTYFGQRIIDHNFGVFHGAYNSKWYEFPVNAQKLYMIVMEGSIINCSYSKRGIFVSSLEGLTSLVSTTFSYAAVFLSVQN